MNTKNIKFKAMVVVKRRWHHPEVLTYINNNEVGVRMQMQDFMRALTDEIYGNRSRYLMLSKAEFLDKSLQGADAILAAMKETTANVV